MSGDRFIPFRKKDIIALCADGLGADIDKTQFSVFCALLVNRIHFEYHQQLESLKDNFAAFDAQGDTRILLAASAQEKAQCRARFANEFADLLDSANFEKVTDEDLQNALSEESLFKVRLEVTFDDFEEMVFYRRGETQKTETLRSFWGLRKKQVTFTNYDRVAVYITFKDAEHFANKKKEPLGFTPGSTIIKLFQNVPKADLEMLFPNSEVRMRPIDKVVIGGSAAIGGIVVLVTKLGASIVLLASLLAFWLGLNDQEVEITKKHLITFGIGMGVFGSFIFKEWTKFKNRKIRFMKALSDNLYFKNLDNNAGVFHTLVDAAEEEDCKEAILAYTFLLNADNQGLSEEHIDQQIEQWFAQTHNCILDFDVTDALEKLVRMNLVQCTDGRYSARSLPEASKILDDYWDNLY
ncbi:TMEM143 family protein [Pseudoalteromonas sp. SSDWG2]|uniref:TMEM143 family protein n=1 Tax=Pseudoalteromonas sp. SSDWG2 TaxID=3139391 RepID=UPI003BAD831E